MGFNKYLEVTTKAEKERMIKYGQKDLAKYRDHVQEVDISKNKIPEDILTRLPKFWVNQVFGKKPEIYVEDFIDFCKNKISVNNPINDFYFRAIFVNKGNAYFTNSDDILHFILVVYLILIGVLPHTEEILDWHKQKDNVSENTMKTFIALDLFNEGPQYTVKFSGSYSPGSKRKLKMFLEKEEAYKKHLEQYGIDSTKIKEI